MAEQEKLDFHCGNALMSREQEVSSFVIDSLMVWADFRLHLLAAMDNLLPCIKMKSLKNLKKIFQINLLTLNFEHSTHCDYKNCKVPSSPVCAPMTSLGALC